MHDKKINFDIENPEHVYLLGYFWADCSFNIDKQNRGNFSFEIKSEDFEKIEHIVKNVGFTHVGKRFRKKGKQLSKISCSQQSSVRFFLDYHFNERTKYCDIYFNISDCLKVYFIKGFLDGDGSISLDKNGLFRIGFNGPKNQNWSFLEDFCLKNDVSWVIYRKERKSRDSTHKQKIHGYSIFEFTKITERLKFCETLSCCKIGLDRKIKIYHDFKSKFNKKLETVKRNKLFKKRRIAPGIIEILPSRFSVYSLISQCGQQKYLGRFNSLEESIKVQVFFHKKKQ